MKAILGIIVMTFASIGFAAPEAAKPAAPKKVEVNFEVKKDGKAVAAPKIVLAPGTAGKVEQMDSASKNGYLLEVKPIYLGAQGATPLYRIEVRYTEVTNGAKATVGTAITTKDQTAAVAVQKTNIDQITKTYEFSVTPKTL